MFVILQILALSSLGFVFIRLLCCFFSVLCGFWICNCNLCIKEELLLLSVSFWVWIQLENETSFIYGFAGAVFRKRFPQQLLSELPQSLKVFIQFLTNNKQFLLLKLTNSKVWNLVTKQLFSTSWKTTTMENITVK